MTRAVFLDRDGVLNEAIVRDGRPYPPSGAGELKIFPGAASALQQLKRAGFMLIVITNQPDVARGTQSLANVEAIHRAVADALPIDDIFSCCHDDGDACTCRKPKPGLLLDAAERHRIDLQDSFLIGDRWRDIDAGAAAGCSTVLIDYHYNEKAPQNPPAYRASSLQSAVDWILANEKVSL